QKMTLTPDGKQWAEGCGDQKVDDLVVVGTSSATQTIQKCSTPTPAPSPTKGPDTPTPAVTVVPPTSTPSVDELRARAGETATVQAAAFATRYAEDLARSQPTAAPTQPPQRSQPTSAPPQPTAAPPQSTAVPTQRP